MAASEMKVEIDINWNFANELLTPKKIIYSERTTIVFWNDGTKTIVKCSEDTEPDSYSAFTAALAKKIYGSNSQIKKILRDKLEIQKSERMEKKRHEELMDLLKQRREREEAERPQKIMEHYEDETADAINKTFKRLYRRRRTPE